MSDIILHHYDASPFTQKAQRMLGLKGLAWRSVETPMILPKPDLVCLTGGYRGTPVMQIGADIYIDSQCIARELERRWPEPSLFPGNDPGLAYALVKWGDEFFQAGLTMALAILGPDWDPAFLADRKAIFTHVDFDQLGDDVEHAMAQLRASAALLDAQLADGRAFLTGDQPGLADIQAFGVPWFTRAALPVTEQLLGQFRHLPGWEARVAALGQGERTDIDVSVAHAEAREQQPDLSPDIDPDDPQKLAAGMQVRVAADDFSDRGAVDGALVTASALEIAVHRRTDDFGDLVVHFPRLGYRVLPLE
ncbi:MAG: glutathione S-transferase family protein [Chromatiales bacterium]|nr:MAG: glutathione S-transferase family protein [Chromatiales bacterium]